MDNRRKRIKWCNENSVDDDDDDDDDDNGDDDDKPIKSLFFLYSKAQIFVTAPNIFHLGVEETVSVILYNIDSPVNVTIIAQEFPGKQRNLATASGIFTGG